jgi:hypothetical protein
VSWLERIRARPSAAPSAGESEEDVAAPGVERTAPALAALFGALREDGGHSILDLGPASDRHLRFFSRFARRIRFAGWLPEPPRGAAWATALSELPASPEQPYDVVLVWDLLDALDDAERAALIVRLATLAAPGARLYAVIDATGSREVQPMRTSIVGPDRVSCTPVGAKRRAPGEPLLPAPLERLLRPFDIAHAYMLRSGHREYVATRARSRSG